MGINIKLFYNDESIHNLAFIKALLIKYRIEKLNVNNSERDKIRKRILKELEKNNER